MKDSLHCIPTHSKWVFIILFSFLFYSCNSYYFSHPQPIDRKNNYRFPKAFQGRWQEDELKEVKSSDSSKGVNTKKEPNFVGDSDTSFFIINKKAFYYIEQRHEKIAKGAWPKPGEKGELQYAPPQHSPFTSIHYDSLQHPTDTIDNYILRGDFIYETEDDDPVKAYRYQSTADEIVMERNDTLCIDLGQNAFLRKLNKQYWALNIRYSVFGEHNGWWLLVILEKGKHGHMTVWQCNTKTGELPSMFHKSEGHGDNFYFNSSWTTGEMLRLLHEGYFEVSDRFVRQ